ncbi:MAG TPA: hypothetical protein VNP03_07315 [Pseudonocardia sp.]|nr:hypothetical protein [Pseudonocardia sp.]
MVNEDRAHAMLVVGLLTVDAALLAMMELMFLTLALGVVPLPISALLALVSTPWLVRRAGELGGAGSASAPLIAWALTVAVLGLAGPGGDVLLLGDWSSLALVVAGLVPAAFVLGRVLRGKRTARSAPQAPSAEATAPASTPHIT